MLALCRVLLPFSHARELNLSVLSHGQMAVIITRESFAAKKQRQQSRTRGERERASKLAVESEINCIYKVVTKREGCV